MTLSDRIRAANELLVSWEPLCVTADPTTDYIGYKAQFIVDAMNSAIGPENWYYEVGAPTVRTEETRRGETEEYEFLLRLYLNVAAPGEAPSFLCKGPVYGGGRGDRDETDGKKAGISDALKKAASYWGIGNKAYRGELTKPTGAMKSMASRGRGTSRPPQEEERAERTAERTESRITTMTTDDIEAVKKAIMAVQVPVEGTLQPFFSTSAAITSYLHELGFAEDARLSTIPAVTPQHGPTAPFLLKQLDILAKKVAGEEAEPASIDEGALPWS